MGSGTRPSQMDEHMGTVVTSSFSNKIWESNLVEFRCLSREGCNDFDGFLCSSSSFFVAEERVRTDELYRISRNR